MRTALICCCSAVLGSFLTLWLVDTTPTASQALAQSGRGPALTPPSLPAPVPSPGPRTQTPGIPQASPAPPPLTMTPDEAVNVAVYESCNRAAVNISTKSVRYSESFLMAFPQVESGSGSGSIIDKQGHVLTNYHVVSGAKQVEVTLFNEKSYPATTVGADPVNDIVILKIDAPPESLFPVPIGDSDHLKVGMRCFALGNPFGLDRTMSEGIISSLNRSLEVQADWIIKSIIQIDAAVNPGNSGGPLLDSRGHMIGMNVAIATRLGQEYGQSAGIGFAIPSSLIKRVIPELIQHGRVIRGEMGVSHVSETENGLRIVRMEPGGPAERAGLRGPQTVRQRRGPFNVDKVDRSAADTIVAIDGQPVTSAAAFHSVLEGKKPRDVVQLTILRDGRTITVPVTLGGEEVPPPQQRPGQGLSL